MNHVLLDGLSKLVFRLCFKCWWERKGKRCHSKCQHRVLSSSVVKGYDLDARSGIRNKPKLVGVVVPVSELLIPTTDSPIGVNR